MTDLECAFIVYMYLHNRFRFAELAILIALIPSVFKITYNKINNRYPKETYMYLVLYPSTHHPPELCQIIGIAVIALKTRDYE